MLIHLLGIRFLHCRRGVWYTLHMDDSKPLSNEKYVYLIAAIANGSVGKVAGVTQEIGLVKYKFGLSVLKDRNVHVYLDGNAAIIDIFVNVDFGVVIPEVICELQETIKKDVEEATPFTVKKINVTVANLNL